MTSSQTISVVGAGLMGVGIATHFARFGLPVRLFDVDPKRIAEVPGVARSILAELADSGRFDGAQADTTVARLRGVTDLEALAGSDLVIEAAPERLALKHRLYADLERVLGDDAIIASNTSGFPPDQLAEGMRRPQRLLIAHFWNPPHFIPLVELVPGTATDPALLQRLHALLVDNALESVILKRAVPGFVGNRIQFAILREALHLLQEGVADAATIDTVMKASLGRRYGMVGPLEAADMGGLDTFLDISRHLMPELAKDEHVLAVLEQKVAAGQTGVRSGEGFYQWDVARRERIKRRREHQLRHALLP
ncbi:3-hydroxyacyl-CoA dehydrogenase family protein [Chitinasiproducens palmae]|uniref:L-gulonate 3-dehydrogenase n=1 Tax=Chitinasiproducens palmae TaxID=1770053 RepID=A0A1H2PIN3_9BURK|nr:3-hydroxyacyl-CoA dehydrogenase family protein [Chitinasiproducens palmae]SDV46152.1 3-hydroxybutyryl-CoA dehydrogenase [Chitinasiproducens palmae]